MSTFRFWGSFLGLTLLLTAKWPGGSFLAQSGEDEFCQRVELLSTFPEDKTAIPWLKEGDFYSFKVAVPEGRKQWVVIGKKSLTSKFGGQFHQVYSKICYIKSPEASSELLLRLHKLSWYELPGAYLLAPEVEGKGYPLLYSYKVPESIRMKDLTAVLHYIAEHADSEEIKLAVDEE